ncbi:MAG: class I SAM-dependent methyltransferase [Streptosporangiaceae bacterium]
MSAVQDQDTVYASPEFQSVDVGSIMRTGHPDIAEGDSYIVSAVRKLRSQTGRPLRIIDVGSGSADLSAILAEQLPDSEIVANDVAPNPVAQAREKLARFPRTRVFDQPFETWQEPVDVVISWGSHHHLSHDYLTRVREILSEDGILIIGDEFCPEYLTPADRERLAVARQVAIIDGYIFDNPDDVAGYRDIGRLPEWSERLEEARRRTLWTWYKFVGDYAVQHDAWSVLIAELAIARDDLVTNFAGEHKTSPYLLERELQLNDFEITDRKTIGDREPALLSFVIYTVRPAGKE